MVAELRVLDRVQWPTPTFSDRRSAGLALAKLLVTEPHPNAVVLALPRGGVPVGARLAEALQCPLSPVAVRKLPIPTSPEMGFGAVTLDGTVTLNHAVMRQFGITFGQSALVIDQVKDELKRRSEAYPGSRDLPHIEGRRVYVVDDGLATGYTMLATAEMVRSRDPAEVIVAVPVAPVSTLELVAEHCDRLVCLVAQESGSQFAVASFYVSFPDLADAEVQAELSASSRRSLH